MRSVSLLALASAVGPAAASLDWRSTGCVGAVMDQGHLGTADLVPSVEAMECALFNSTQKLIKLSTEQVKDCAPELDQFGDSFEYIHKYGLETAAAYPSPRAEVARPKCIYEESLVAVKLDKLGGSATGPATEKDVENALHHAPVAAAFTVGTELELYTGGVLSDCGEGGTHVMEIVGFSDPDPDQNNTAYWIVKNTWGEQWGMKGYAHILKDQGACGLEKPTYLYPLEVSIVEETKHTFLRPVMPVMLE